MDVQEQASGATGMQQHHKELIPKRVITSNKQGKCYRETLGLEIAKILAASSVRIRQILQHIMKEWPLPK
jgi:hypothetical protein